MEKNTFEIEVVQETCAKFVVLSIGDAQSVVSLIQPPYSDEERETLSHVAQYVIENEAIFGDENDYHNLASEYARRDDFYNAFRVVEKGLKQYPYNIDLLADGIRFGASCGEYKSCENLICIAKTRPYEMWNWRLFTFTIKYLETSLSWKESMDDLKNTFNEALAIAEKYQTTLVYDEGGFNAAAELYLLNSDRANAKQVLKRAIWGSEESSNLIAPKCCVTYIDMLEQEGNYDEIATVALKGMEYTAQQQPSAQVGFFLFMYALALDALIHRNNTFGDKTKVKDALQNYELAESILRTTTLTETAKIRAQILSQKGNVEYASRTSSMNANDLMSVIDIMKKTRADGGCIEDRVNGYNLHNKGMEDNPNDTDKRKSP